MSFRHPCQKLCYVKASTDLPEALLAASGPRICWFDFQRGLLSRWPVTQEDEDLSDSETEYVNGNDDGEPPAKKQRLSGDEEDVMVRQESEESVEIISERVKGQRRKPKPVTKVKFPDISHMVATSDGKYIIIVTTDDKCIRVLERRKSGRLRNISARSMPKRLCAITLTKDEKTLVAGDKFGDVYSLPLFPSEDYHPKTPSLDQQNTIPDFKPSASELTVHTKGNLEALRQQQQQKNFKAKKESLAFEHKLLLGHVSLLTDLAIAEVEGDAPVRGRRQYILTADRDEHIRVSRGISQAHIIENYCLGHRDFVSRLCVLPWQTTTLVAGSGEPSLKVYDWRRGNCTVDLLSVDGTLDTVREHIYKTNPGSSTSNLAISGIWPVSTGSSTGYILAAFEGLPLLLSYAHDGDNFTSTPLQMIPLAGNVLDVTAVVDGDPLFIIVSLDTVHASGSVKTRRTAPLSPGEALVSFQLQKWNAGDDQISNTDSLSPQGKGAVGAPSRWVSCANARGVHDALTTTATEHRVMAEIEAEEEGRKDEKAAVKAQAHHQHYSKLGESLYGLENLRKRRVGGGGPQEEEEDQGEHVD